MTYSICQEAIMKYYKKLVIMLIYYKKLVIMLIYVSVILIIATRHTKTGTSDTQWDGALIHLTNETSTYSSTSASFWIVFRRSDLCLAPGLNDTMVLAFCNPRIDQSFIFEEGKLVMRNCGRCVGRGGDSNVVLKKCGDLPSGLGHVIEIHSGKISIDGLCITENHKDSPGHPVSLGKCSFGSAITLETSEFLKSRAALLLPIPEDSTCTFPACGINHQQPAPAALLPPEQVDRCEKLADCVTVVCKTGRRPYYVIRLAESLFQQTGERLHMVVIDDGIGPYPQVIMDEIASIPNMRYIITNGTDLGISEGRTMGVSLVTTKYFFLLDDDIVLNNRTDVHKMVEILDTTDATLVGGRANLNFAGFLHFMNHPQDNSPTLRYNRGSCSKAKQHIPAFPECIRCDVTTNIFIAKTQHVLESGGWSKELKVIEHKDFFLRLKSQGRKIVLCPGFQAANGHGTSGKIKKYKKLVEENNKRNYVMLRHGRTRAMKIKFMNRWNIAHLEDDGYKK